MKIQKDLTGSNLEWLLNLCRFKSCNECKSYVHCMNKQGWKWCLYRFKHLNKHLFDKARSEGYKISCWFTFVPLALSIILSILRINKNTNKPPITTTDAPPPNQMIKAGTAFVDIKKSTTIFDRVSIVNLARRQDRLDSLFQKIPESFWNLVGTPTTVSAIDTLLCPSPKGWNIGNGWGCYRSHLRIIEECLNNKTYSVLLLEDDFTLGATVGEASQAIKEIEIFFDNVPDDWGMIWLGGHHHKNNQQQFRKINNFVLQPYNCQGTYAFGIRGKEMMIRVYHWLNQSREAWQKDHHIDHHLGRLVEEIFEEKIKCDGKHHASKDCQKLKVYCPHKWLIGHSAGQSNISGKNNPDDEYFNRWTTDYTVNQHIPLVAVLGTFRGGTSCVAGVLHHLGVHMGQKFKKPTPANPQGFWEAQQLGRICREAYKEPWMKELNTYDQRVMSLKIWGNSRRDDVVHTEKEHHLTQPDTPAPLQIAGGKHPTLSLLVLELEEAWGPNVKYIVVNRSLDSSVASIKKLGWGWPQKKKQIRTILQRIIDVRDEGLDQIDSEKVLFINYEELISDPHREVNRICEFLDINPSTEEYKMKAIKSINPKLQHH